MVTHAMLIQQSWSISLFKYKDGSLRVYIDGKEPMTLEQFYKWMETL